MVLLFDCAEDPSHVAVVLLLHCADVVLCCCLILLIAGKCIRNTTRQH
jgi:hypothetical protein